MSLSSTTFSFYTDSAGTTPFTGSFSYLHKTDLSDNPQDKVLYLMSKTASRRLVATSNPGVDQITITPTDILPAWQASQTYLSGQAIEPTSPNTFWYECVVSGVSGSSQPTWPTGGIGSTVSDGSTVWKLNGKKHPISEIKLATTSGGLAAATGGAALNIGTQVLSTVPDAQPIWIRMANSVTSVSNDINQPHTSLFINDVVEEIV